jgi:hypothetical protein
MGCDIHAMIERRKKFPGDSISGTPHLHQRWWVNMGDPEIGRNYTLFAMLAGVRNGLAITPAAEPKGIHEDACSEFRYFSDGFGTDGHSHSWLTLRELKDYAARAKDYVSDGIIEDYDLNRFESLIDRLERIRADGPICEGIGDRVSQDNGFYTDDDMRLSFFFDN